MPEMICPTCGGGGQVQQQKVEWITGPDGTQIQQTSTVVVQCSSCGGTGRKQY
ncbi:hypothetical protein KV557_15450 [Kitasatospora aureofaciens]|uniref:hypothetical protein n=1 Tax=Kitasatospora aureofaciens TaxID=1894 RepID=UPI001C4773AA|nr:hypothetical protein [Kitasatospora aureofaciens]MBV6698508.1 hypothetical protein [Kitasatospora aureofaciens]